MKLVTDTQEQDRLEQLLESSKPPYPKECRGLHYLLFTPFRYRPYKNGSRFRRPNQIEGVFYASELPHTALTEKAYYSLRFYADSPDTPLPDNPVQHTVFSVKYRTNRAIDLNEPPLNADESRWRDPADHAACQDLADEARKANIQAIKSASVRCPKKGKNISLLSCTAFESKQPDEFQTWQIAVQPEHVVTVREFPRETLTFPIGDFTPKVRLKNPTHITKRSDRT